MAEIAPGDKRPVYTVVAGPNGSGKSTLVDGAQNSNLTIGPFINPDVIAKALPADTSARDLAAGKEALLQTKARIAAGESFSRESTLSGNEIMNSMRAAKTAGFRVNMVYVAVPNVDVAIERVKHRVALGGHDIPEKVQRRRFEKSIDNAAKAAKFVDRVVMHDNPTGVGHREVAIVHQGTVQMLAADRPKWVDRVIEGLERALGIDRGTGSPKRSVPPFDIERDEDKDQGR